MNQVISSKDARVQFAEILNQVIYTGKEFTISRFDKPVARIVPIRAAQGDEEIKRRKKNEQFVILACPESNELPTFTHKK